jgi:hypothetical protein
MKEALQLYFAGVAHGPPLMMLVARMASNYLPSLQLRRSSQSPERFSPGPGPRLPESRLPLQ